MGEREKGEMKRGKEKGEEEEGQAKRKKGSLDITEY